MSKFQEFRKKCEPSGKSKSNVAHVALTAKQLLQAQRRGEGQMALIVHVESARKEAFSDFYGEIAVEVEGVEGPVTLQKFDHNLVWIGNQTDEEGFEKLFNLLYTEDFESKVNGLEEIEDLDARRKAAKKIRSTIPAKISFDMPVKTDEQAD